MLEVARPCDLLNDMPAVIASYELDYFQQDGQEVCFPSGASTPLPSTRQVRRTVGAGTSSSRHDRVSASIVADHIILH